MEVHETVERALATQTPFGNDISILDGRRDRLIGQLEDLTQRMPEANELIQAVTHRPDGDHHRLFTETTLRSAIEHAHKQVVFDVPRRPQLLRVTDCAAVFAAAAGYLNCGGTDTPLQDGSLVRLGPKAFHGWIWRDEHPDDPYGRAFRELISTRYRMLPSTPDEDTVELLTTGAELLGELLPALAPSALHHANTVACVPTDKAFFGSSSRPDLGGIFFLRVSLGTPWWIAEHMLHEATHLKLYDVLGAETLLQADGRRVERPVLTPWNPSLLTGANHWHAWRVLAAFHVYVHLALLSTVAERRKDELEGTYGPLSGMIDSRCALDRARYLGRQLTVQPQCWESLGQPGQELTGWLQSLLDVLDADPAPAGATIHLYLDRYHRETERAERMLAEHTSRRRSVRAGLTSLARADIAETRAILRDLKADRQLADFDAAVAGVTDDELPDGYPEIRRAVEMCLRDASPDGYRMGESGALDPMVGQLVESASDQLCALSTRIPEPVAHAKRRAFDQRVIRGCPDEVGRLLAVQAAQLPTGAAVLEIGAGVGLVTAWLVAGLGSREDVHILSVEADETLRAATCTYRWPAFVRIDARDDQRGGFDLVVADASACTADRVDAIVDATTPTGVLIFYNTADPAAGGDDNAAAESLRQTLLDDDRLVVAAIDWSSGVLMATKSA